MSLLRVFQRNASPPPDKTPPFPFPSLTHSLPIQSKPNPYPSPPILLVPLNLLPKVPMAQRDKKEEPMELHAPEIALCANSCGFPGNPATKNLCQNCFLAASASASASPPSPSSSSSSSSSSSKTAPYPVVDEPGPAAEVKAAVTMKAENPTAAGVEVRTARSANRCGSCRKRVGLTGFRCRCGDLFCGAHRYTDRHECSYDYKAAARDAIARENPVVRAAKIVRF